MEVKINKEIRNYTEAVFFGLSLRQLIFSMLACVSSVCVYFIFEPWAGLEMTSWLCILVALPFAFLGFVRYNGMSAEKFALAWIKSNILVSRRLVFKPRNLYFEIMKPVIKKHRKENYENA